MYMNDPHILNQDVDANQPDFFDKTISVNLVNLFNFSLFEIFHEPKAMKKVEDEDNRFFGTHIRETIKTFKEVFKK